MDLETSKLQVQQIFLPLAYQSNGNEEANMCSMAKGESETSSVSSSTSINFEYYSQLLDVFKETHEKTNRLIFYRIR